MRFHFFGVNNRFKLPNITQVMLMCVTLSVGVWVCLGKSCVYDTCEYWSEGLLMMW